MQCGEVLWGAPAPPRAVSGAPAGERAQAAPHRPAELAAAGQGRPAQHVWARALPGKRVPDSLLAICRKALAFDPAARYPSVEALQRDLLAYQNGFATSAEKAGAWKQVTLLIKRNKAASIGAAAVLLVGSVLGAGATVQGRRATAALVSLRAAAPTLAAQAQTLLGEQKLDDAIAKLDFALTIDPRNQDYLLRRANYLQAAGRLDEAITAYRQRLTIGDDNTARLNLALCEKLVIRATDTISLRELYGALNQQGRHLEAALLAGRLGLGSTATETLIKEVLRPLEKLPEWKANTHRLYRDGSGEFSLELNGLPITDLSFLRKLQGQPIKMLNIGGTLTHDLSPLADLPITWIEAYSVPVEDFSALAGKQLTNVGLAYTRVSSLELFRGMPIRSLLLNKCSAISDFSPLAGMPLERGVFEETKLSSLEFLRGAPLQSLDVARTSIKSLSGLENSPLETIRANGCYNLANIEALRGLQLRRADFESSDAIKDPSPLLDCPNLEELVIGDLPGLTKLRAMPKLNVIGYTNDSRKSAAEFWKLYDALVEVRAAVSALGLAAEKTKIIKPWGIFLELAGQSFENVTPLCQLPVQAIGLGYTQVSDLAPLRGMKLRGICFDGTAVKDVSPLLDMPGLEWALVNQQSSNLDVLRNHPTLKHLGWSGDDWLGPPNGVRLSTGEFWARYDALKTAGKK